LHYSLPVEERDRLWELMDIEIQSSQKDLSEFITKNGGIIKRQYGDNSWNEMWADVPISLLNELEKRSDVKELFAGVSDELKNR
jgi:hypothetical protein